MHIQFSRFLNWPSRRLLLWGILIGIACSSPAVGRPVCDPAPALCPEIHTRASLRALMVRGNLPVSADRSSRYAGGRRSVPLAFGLSAVVPGLGQAYNRHWTKAIVAAVLEAAVITTWVTWRQQGLDAEDDFKRVAHSGWNPTRYASWLNDYSDYLVEAHGAVVTAPPVDIISSVDFQNPGSWSLADRQAVSAMFDQIHRIERQMFHPETGATFSHVLPGFGEQQYYELIGKYFQFAPGWFDYPDWIGENGDYTEAIDPERSGPGGSKPNVSSSFYDYAEEHADAQDTLRRASHISLLLVVNHLVAAVEAAISSKLHNDRLSTNMGFSYVPGGTTVPVAVVSYRF